MSNWQFLFVLPNLIPPKPSPFEVGGICLCAGDDPRLEQLESTPINKVGRELLRRFTTQLGAAYTPGCVLVRSDAPKAAQTDEALRSFRNACALATTIPGWARNIMNTGTGWEPLYADLFTFDPHLPHSPGFLTTLDAPVRGLSPIVDFRGQCAPQVSLPTGFLIRPDKILLDRLLKAWEGCYIRGAKHGPLRRLFRSLEIAFHASRYPSDGLLSVHDLGTRLGLWVSAFEVLLHPHGSTGVNKRIVQEALRRVPWRSGEIVAPRYRISYMKKNLHVCLPEALYDDLYWARNQFFHGEKVAVAHLHYHQSKRYAPLWAVAPLLFGAVLRYFLDTCLPSTRVFEPPQRIPLRKLGKWMETARGRLYLDSMFCNGLKDIEKALLISRKPLPK